MEATLFFNVVPTPSNTRRILRHRCSIFRPLKSKYDKWKEKKEKKEGKKGKERERGKETRWKAMLFFKRRSTVCASFERAQKFAFLHSTIFYQLNPYHWTQKGKRGKSCWKAWQRLDSLPLLLHRFSLYLIFTGWFKNVSCVFIISISKGFVN